MFPFFWVFLASVKETEYLYGPHAFDVIVPGYTLDNYVSVFVNHPFGRYLLNSLTVAGLTMLYSLFVASFAAYAIARLQFFSEKRSFFWVCCWRFPCFRRSLRFPRFSCSCRLPGCATRIWDLLFRIRLLRFRYRSGT